MAVSHPQWRARAFASPGPTIPRCSSGTWGCPCCQQIARAGPLCGGPVDIFRRPLCGMQKFGIWGQAPRHTNLVLPCPDPSRVFLDREVDISGNERRPADSLLEAWDGKRDLAVDLTIVPPNPFTGRPLRGSAATFVKDRGERKCRESADSCGRMGVDFSSRCSTGVGDMGHDKCAAQRAGPPECWPG